MKLKMNSYELRYYVFIYITNTHLLDVDFDNKNDHGIRYITFHRKLCLAVLSTDLNELSIYNNDPAIIEKYY